MKKNLIVSAIISSLVLPLAGCGDNDNSNQQLSQQQQFERQQKLDQYKHEERMKALEVQSKSQHYGDSSTIEDQEQNQNNAYTPNNSNQSVQQQPQHEQYDDELETTMQSGTNSSPQNADSGYGAGQMALGVAAGAAIGGLAAHMWSKKTDSQGNVHYFENGKEKSASDYKSFMQRAKEKTKVAATKTKELGKAAVAKSKLVGAASIDKARKFGSSAQNRFSKHQPVISRHASNARKSIRSFGNRVSSRAHRSFGGFRSKRR
ncbi:hypothetical protein [Photobacterium damselae]|uniref:hypothetical protein n=1 Tax=Photobacterium damselae TaxID=38293 RepID=UPI0040690EE0